MSSTVGKALAGVLAEALYAKKLTVALHSRLPRADASQFRYELRYPGYRRQLYPGRWSVNRAGHISNEMAVWFPPLRTTRREVIARAFSVANVGVVLFAGELTAPLSLHLDPLGIPTFEPGCLSYCTEAL